MLQQWSREVHFGQTGYECEAWQPQLIHFVPRTSGWGAMHPFYPRLPHWLRRWASGGSQEVNLASKNSITQEMRIKTVPVWWEKPSIRTTAWTKEGRKTGSQKSLKGECPGKFQRCLYKKFFNPPLICWTTNLNSPVNMVQGYGNYNSTSEKQQAGDTVGWFECICFQRCICKRFLN